MAAHAPRIRTASPQVTGQDHCYDCGGQNFRKHEEQHPNKAAAAADASAYYVCDCTSCRNLGNSVDICCQCCNCTGVDPAGHPDVVYQGSSNQRYHVSSVTLTGEADDTLEVVFDDNEEDYDGQDEIAMAHAAAESGGTCECPPPKPGCADCCGRDGKKPVFNGWSQQRVVQNNGVRHHHYHHHHHPKHVKNQRRPHCGRQQQPRAKYCAKGKPVACTKNIPQSRYTVIVSLSKISTRCR